MQPIFTSTMPFEAERIAAVAIYCSDGRYGDQFDEFMHRHLGLPRYDRLAIPGGAAWLGWRSSASLGHYGLLSDQLDFLVQVHDLRRAVLIAHYGCAYYLRRHPGDADSLLPTQIQDLRDAASTLRNRYTRLQVETYLARADGDQVSFVVVPDR
jgi:Putative carbonic anhydrase